MTARDIDRTIGPGQAADPPSVDLPATLAARYELGRTLGAGGFGEVRLARDTRLDSKVVVKVLHADWSAQTAARESFLAEARILRRVQHPNVVTVYDVGEDPAGLYIVMEHCTRGSLADVLATRPRLPVGEAVRVAADMLAGLDAAHAAGVVHRDVKPSNVLLAEDGTFKVADFGLAKLGDQRTGMSSAGRQPGTLRYMSPEQAEGREPDRRSDLYSVGVVLYEMLAGAPYLDLEPKTDLARRMAIVQEDPDFSALDAPAPLVAVLRRALAKDPSGRWQSAAEFRKELVAVGPTAPGGTRMPVRILVLALVALVVAAALAGAFYTLTSEDAEPDVPPATKAPVTRPPAPVAEVPDGVPTEATVTSIRSSRDSAAFCFRGRGTGRVDHVDVHWGADATVGTDQPQPGSFAFAGNTAMADPNGYVLTLDGVQFCANVPLPPQGARYAVGHASSADGGVAATSVEKFDVGGWERLNETRTISLTPAAPGEATFDVVHPSWRSLRVAVTARNSANAALPPLQGSVTIEVLDADERPVAEEDLAIAPGTGGSVVILVSEGRAGQGWKIRATPAQGTAGVDLDCAIEAKY